MPDILLRYSISTPDGDFTGTIDLINISTLAEAKIAARQVLKDTKFNLRLLHGNDITLNDFQLVARP